MLLPRANGPHVENGVTRVWPSTSPRSLTSISMPSMSGIKVCSAFSMPRN